MIFLDEMMYQGRHKYQTLLGVEPQTAAPEEFVREYKEKKYWEDITLGEHFDNWVAQ
jgi:hypothetical protein